MPRVQRALYGSCYERVSPRAASVLPTHCTYGDCDTSWAQVPIVPWGHPPARRPPFPSPPLWEAAATSWQLLHRPPGRSSDLFLFKEKLIAAQEGMRELQTERGLRPEKLALGKQTRAATAWRVMLNSERDFWNPDSGRRSGGKPTHCFWLVSNYISHILFISSKGTSNYYTILSPYHFGGFINYNLGERPRVRLQMRLIKDIF